jgi:DNA modification methylase
MLNPPKLQIREEITVFPSLSAPEPAMRPLLYDQFLEVFKQEARMPKALSDYPHESFGYESFIFNADSMELLKLLPSNSVDSIVCDPPYHIGDTKKRNGKSSAGIMGLNWDGGDIAFRPDIWRECLRVLKPGGHMLTFGYSRNYFRMVVAIEDAGFEIRDIMKWIYTSAMPRSFNVSKSVKKSIQKNINGMTESNWGFSDISSGITPEQFIEIYDGYGSKLKPCYEPIVMARKPLSERSLVKNILKWGVGVININKCRIEVADKKAYEANMRGNERSSLLDGELTNNMKGGYKQNSSPKEIPGGRWPGNIMLADDFNEDYNKFFFCSKPNEAERNEGLEDFEYDRTGNTVSSNSTFLTRCKICMRKKSGSVQSTCKCENPSFDNSVSKYKNFHPTPKPLKLLRYLVTLVTPIGGTILDPFAGSSTVAKACLTIPNGEYKFIAVEREEDYYALSVANIKSAYNKFKTNK